MPPADEAERWKWENAAAGAVAGFATVAALHPLDVVRTRFQGLLLVSLLRLSALRMSQTIFSFPLLVTDGRASHLPLYRNTAHAIYTIARTEVGYFCSPCLWFVCYYSSEICVFMMEQSTKI